MFCLASLFGKEWASRAELKFLCTSISTNAKSHKPISHYSLQTCGFL